MRRFRSQLPTLLGDIVGLLASYYGAAFAVLGRRGFPDAVDAILQGAPVVIAITLAAFAVRGVYRSVARYASLGTFVALGQALAAAAAISAVPFFALKLHQPIPWRLLPVYAGFAMGVTAAIRLAGPLWRTRADHRPGRRVLVYGAGDGGEAVVREIIQNRALGYAPVGFVDDQPAKQGLTIHGLRVLGRGDDLSRIVSAREVDEILIAVPSATGAQMRRMLARCRSAQRREGTRRLPAVTTVPGMGALLSGQVGAATAREVLMEDLLRRSPRDLDPRRVERLLTGKRVMVTGAGGSIGSELCRRVAATGPARLVMVDHSEYNLYNIDIAIADAHPELPRRAVLGDVAEAEPMAALFAAERPEVLVHAAAYKHVPIVEENPCVGIINNVSGTVNLARLARRYEALSMVNISTDKAVRPLSVMGATKRLGEMYLQHLNARCATRFMSVRFANVLGSSGSVVPRFQRQIAAGGPVTVTHPETTRYFMLASEAAQLVLQAAAIGDGGEVFVLDMGEPVRIKDLAETLIQLAGHEPNVDIQIKFTGLRAGEKLHEELSIDEPDRVPAYESILIDGGSPTVAWEGLDQTIDELVRAAGDGDRERALETLHALVPGFARREAAPGVRSTA